MSADLICAVSRFGQQAVDNLTEYRSRRSPSNFSFFSDAMVVSDYEPLPRRRLALVAKVSRMYVTEKLIVAMYRNRARLCLQ